MFPNLAAIARVCETSPEVVRSVVEKREGLEGYLQTGCLLGEPGPQEQGKHKCAYPYFY
jgi:hypothetical protein